MLSLRNIGNKIKRNDPSIKFKGLSGNRIHRKLQEIEKHYDEFSDEIGSPRWEGSIHKHVFCKLDKNYIYEHSSTVEAGDKKVESSIRAAYKPIDKIYELFNEIDDTVNRLPLEMLYKE